MIRMLGEVTNVRYTPGRSQDTNRCRFCNETEILAHVLGKYEHGKLLRHARHNKVVQLIAAALKLLGYTVHVELHCIAPSGSYKRVDIPAIEPVTDGRLVARLLGRQ